MGLRTSAVDKKGWLREWQWIAFLFAAAVVIAFPQVVFLGRSLVPSDNENPFDARINRTNYGPNYVPGEAWTKRGLVTSTNFLDPGGGWWVGEPALQFFRRAVYSGEFPFWDPSAGGGAPAYANPTSAFLFPPQVALSLAGATSLQKNIYILFLFWAAGYTTYWFLRLHGLSPQACFGGGVAFVFSGAMQQTGPSTFMGQVVASMPLLLLATKWFLNNPSLRRTALLALVYAGVSLASFAPVLIAGFAFSGLYFVSALLIDVRDKRLQVLSRYATAVVLSLVCTAIYYLPVLITIGYTDYATAWYRNAGREILPFKAIFELLSPAIAATEAQIYINPVLKLSEFGHFFYIGVAAIFIALTGAFASRGAPWRSLVICCVGGIIIVLLKMFGVPPVQWIARLPVFQSIHYTLYFGTFIALAASLLAAAGLQRLRDGRGSLLVFGITIGIMIAGFSALWYVASETGALRKPGAERWITDYQFLLAVFIAVSALVAIALMQRVIPRVSAGAGWLMVGLVMVEGIINATYPRQKRWDVFAHPPAYVSTMRRLPQDARAYIGGALVANLGSAFGITEFDSLYMLSAPRMYRLYRRYALPASPITLRDAMAIPADRILDRAAINYLLIRYEIPALFNEAVHRGYLNEYDDGYVRLFRRESPPRYLFSSDYVVATSATALSLIAELPPKQIVLENRPGFEPSPNDVNDPAVEVVSARLNSLTLRVQAPRPGLVYIADASYPGWSASVNGRPANILTANYAFRAVAVPAGDAVIKLHYVPSGLLAGAIISAMGFALAAVLITRRSRADAAKP